MSELHPRIAVIGGAGYVGLITGVGFASLGYNTTCVDINEQRVNQLANASSPIHEPGLEPLLRQLLDNRQINFTTDAANALANSNIVVIAVGSPSLPNGRADISQAINAIETVATNASPNSTIIVKSTLPIGVYPASKRSWPPKPQPSPSSSTPNSCAKDTDYTTSTTPNASSSAATPQPPWPPSGNCTSPSLTPPTNCPKS